MSTNGVENTKSIAHNWIQIVNKKKQTKKQINDYEIKKLFQITKLKFFQVQTK